MKPNNRIPRACLIAITALAPYADAATILSADFIDNFDSSHNFLTNGVTGTGWHGVMSSTSTVFNSDQTVDGHLRMTSTTNWSGAGVTMTAPLLYVNVSGDFIATTNAAGSQIANFNSVGLMVLSPTDQGDLFAAFGSFSSNPRQMTWSTTDGTRAQTEVSTTTGNLNYYQIERSGSTFTARYSNNAGVTWTDITSVTREDLAAQEYLQIGVFHTGVSGSARDAQFDFFEVTLIPEPSSSGLAALSFVTGLLICRRRHS